MQNNKINSGQRQAEKVVIAAILSNVIAPEDTNLQGIEFINPDYGNIFIASKVARGEHGTADLNAIAAYLAVNCKTAVLTPPNPVMLAALARTELPANLLPSVKMIHQSHARQRLMDFSASLAAQSTDETDAPVEIIDRAVRQLGAIRRQIGHRSNNRRHISEIVPEVREFYREMYEDGVSRNITTGFDELDRVAGGGGTPGDVWVIGAGTGQGKSALALEMARRQSKAGVRSLVLSREMQNLENARRVHAAVADVPNWMVKPKMQDRTYNRLIETLDDLGRQNIWFDSESGDVDTACGEIEAAADEDGITVVYADYLQLFRATGNGRMSRMEEIAYCSARFKETAMKAKVWIIEIAQYNRQAVLTGQAENHSFDGASQIEKDASCVLHLELEKNHDPQIIPVWRKGKLRSTKGRNMPTTELPIWYRGETFTVSDSDPDFDDDLRFR